MKAVVPRVYIIARTELDYDEVAEYLIDEGGLSWLQRAEEERSDAEPRGRSGEDLIELSGRMCYRSWEPGLNPNIQKTRTDRRAYLTNILASRHGSVLEHVSVSFIFSNVSRVFTHELVRHRAGCAVSQESLRYVRLDELKFWFPEWAHEDKELMDQGTAFLSNLEGIQRWLARHFKLDEPGMPFHEKKVKTSFMRRFAPEGLGTSIVWTANLRAIRHAIEVRTDPSAEEEIRLVFSRVAQIMKAEYPLIFSDFSRDDATGAWVPSHSKI